MDLPFAHEHAKAVAAESEVDVTSGMTMLIADLAFVFQEVKALSWLGRICPGSDIARERKDSYQEDNEE